ncbi:MAG: M1 family metallopeptidase [Myxococcales bacterium]|nr:M1 family metallopeptidase [Myxococcales bacterium]MCB9749298.1 M1 family metallopeptidase [Myxococcales bacterium]
MFVGVAAYGRARRYGGPALAVLLALTLACDAPSVPESAPVPEPSAALRPPEARGHVPSDARVADYVIDARLDADEHQVTGTVRITWRNRTSRTVDDLQLHTYMNAFRAEDTAWMREARGGHRGSSLAHEDDAPGWGYVDLLAVRRLDHESPPPPRGASELSAAAPVQLRWAEGEDPSVTRVALDEPLGPNDQVTVELDFVTQLPRVFARTGYAGDFHMLGQWYPKIAVLETGGWRNHVFTLNAEFYADFGDYTVHLDVPENMIVGASGVLVEERVEDGRKRLRYDAEMVHDFAWVADPDFVEHLGEWHGIRIRQLLQPEHARDAPQHLAAQIAALESMEARFGPYPWSTITIVHVPKEAKGAGGMEYPTLYTTSDILARKPWHALVGFDERLSGVFTTIHEFGHQYFQGLLASNEQRQPWLDEGMNTFSNGLAIMDWTQSESPVVARLGNQVATVDQLGRLTMLVKTDLVPVDSAAEEFPKLTESYGSTVYRKTAALMQTLRSYVGHPRFDAALRVYAERWRFRHPTGDDLVATLLEQLGPRATLTREGDERVELDVRDYLDQALHTVRRVDFELERVQNRRAVSSAGWHRDEHGALVGGEPPAEETSIAELADDELEGVVVVRRKGDFQLPVELEIEFSDGAVVRRWWDGRDAYRIFVWPGRRVARATVDPDRLIALESYTLNNTRFAPELERDDGLSRPIGDTVELVELALLGGLGL